MADMTEVLGLRLHADGVVAASNGVKVTADAVQNLGAKADGASKPVAALGTSTKQTSMAMRQLPMQITDVVTSLSSGMPVWMVAIQQGGQIRDSFGGIGPALRAVTSMISPLTFGLMGLGGAAAVAAVAFNQGQRESTGYRQAIVLTGNAAGTTVGRLGDMAKGLDAIIGTERQAADALTQLVQTTQVGGQQLMQFAEVAIRMERVTGQSVEKTVAQFADLGKKPLEASVKLNETTNFLTRSLYDQIKALEKQKKFSEAAALAQQAYADTVGGRLKQLEGNLGTLERAWLFVKTAAAEGWDAMLGLGREKSLGEKLKEAEAELARMDNARLQRATASQRTQQDIYQRMFPNRKIKPDTTDEEERAAVVAKIATLKESMRLADSAAQRQAAQTAADRDYIRAQEDKHKATDEGKGAYERLSGEIERHLTLTRAELTEGSKLTEAEKFRVDMLREIGEAEKKLGPVRAAALRDRAATTAALIEELDWVRQANEYQLEHEKKQAQIKEQKLRDAQQGVETLKRERDALFDEIAAIGTNTQFLAERQMMLNNNAIAQRESRLAVIASLPGYEAETAALREQIDLLNEKSALSLRKARAKSADDERQANEKRTKELADSIEEGIFNGFREGGKMADVFLRELKAQFARTVLRAPVQMLAQSGTDLLGMLFKVAGTVFGGGESGNMDPNYPTDNTGPRAWGGNVEPGGTYLVGERGPEILRMGHQRGSVEPNPVMGTGGGGGRVVHMTFAPQISIDSRSDRAQVMADVQRVVRAGQAELLDMMERRQA